MAPPLQSTNHAYDLHAALAAVVDLRTRIPEDAMTAPMLGTERSGHGVLISDDGLIVTIGYLIAEAESIWVIDQHGAAVAGYVLAYDQETGLGLVQTLQPLTITPLPLGRSAHLAVGDPVVVAGHGGINQAQAARITARREFAGYWEYVLDEALFTAPAHPDWGGTAVLDENGRLCGIGSLYIQQGQDDDDPGCNMVVPIDLLLPLLDDIHRYGQIRREPRPWLGVLVTEVGEHLVLAGLIPNGPAEKAGLQAGDLILEVEGHQVGGLAQLFRLLWALGPAGIEVELTIIRDGKQQQCRVPSVNRYDCLKTPHLH